jgi:hypothetical protein
MQLRTVTQHDEDLDDPARTDPDNWVALPRLDVELPTSALSRAPAVAPAPAAEPSPVPEAAPAPAPAPAIAHVLAPALAASAGGNGRRPFNGREAASDIATITILGFRYAVTSFVIVLGAPLFVFFMMVGWDLTLLASLLGDFAVHYQTASAIARSAFSGDTFALYLVAVLIVALMRLPRFLAELDRVLLRSVKP